MTLPNLSRRLAEQVTTVRFEQLGASTVRASCRALLDAVGVMQAASALSDEAAPCLALAAQQASTAPDSGAVILGTGLHSNAMWAAFANGALAHALDYEDAFDAAPVHPNASLIPALLALAQTQRPCSGKALVTALTVGCDVSCRLALSLRQDLEVGGWYPPPILAAFGAAAGAAHLLQLNAAQLLDAWSLMLMQNSASGEIKYAPDSTLRAVREAFPAMHAVNCCLLARAGVKGFAAPLEGQAGFYRLFAGGRYDASDLFDQLGERWWIEQLSFKAWPSCRGTHAAIEAALALRLARNDWAAVQSITIAASPVQRMLAEPAAQRLTPRTAIDAKFSLPFTVATALTQGAVNLESFHADALRDATTLEFASRVSFTEHEGWGRDKAVASQLLAYWGDGTSWQQEIIEPVGAVSRPLSDAALMAKFLDCAARAVRPLSPTQARNLAERLLQMETEADVAQLPWSAP